MTSRNKVVWSDGLFVKPHHFQQQTRYVETLILRQTTGADGHFYGFTQLSLNEDLLSLGKVAIVSAKGVMPDGTVFSIPEEDVTPAVLDIADGFTANEMAYLCLPLAMESGLEVQEAGAQSDRAGARYEAAEFSVRDNTEQGGEVAPLKIAKVRPMLALGSADLSAFAKLAIGKITEKRADGAIIMDKQFYPTMLSIQSAPELRRFMSELADGLEGRADTIASRIGKPDQTGVADVSDFMLLQALNRMCPYLRHYVRMTVLHPRLVYEMFLQIIGELATFLSETKRAPEMPAYDHDRPDACWPAVTSILRQFMGATLSANAVPIPHQRKLHGYFLAPLKERSLIQESEFVLAVKANVPQERLQRDFAAQAKVSSIERIQELVRKGLPGIPLRLMPVAPRQLPYHAGFSYFGLDKTASAWGQMQNAEGFAFHIAGEFPELDMQFWAVKG